MDYMIEFDESGLHGHMLLRPDGSTASDGTHEHLWCVTEDVEIGDEVLPAGTCLFSFYDGAPVHAVKKGTRTASDGAHKHGVLVGYSARKTFVTAEDAPHSHELLVRRTGRDGIHAHVLDLNGLKIKSLMPDDILAMMMSDDAKDAEVRAEQIVRVSGEVRDSSGILCKHADTNDAVVCAAARRMWALKGFRAPLHAPNLHTQERLFKELRGRILEKSGAGVGGRLMGAMGRLLET